MYDILYIEYHKKKLYEKVRRYLKEVFHKLARQKKCEIVSRNTVKDHVYIYILMPPKLAVSEIIGYLKRKSATAVARYLGEKRRVIFRREVFRKRICYFNCRY